ncbi:MAG: DUF1786 domain-containing protein, partial [Desulfobacterales bacterium]|nr:DUF1786 domain-containing protein [Desulfobacterales bacterium]
MKKFLLVDIGAGTMDVLYYDLESDLHYKAVVRSPVSRAALEAARLPGSLVVTGCEMGGGAVSSVLKRRAREAEVVMSASSAATLHHDPGRVRGWGVRIVDDAEAEGLKRDKRYGALTLRDLEPALLRGIVEGFGVPFRMDAVVVCAQDHGAAPPGVSHLDYRHKIFRSALDRHPSPHALLHARDEIPAEMTRLSAIAESAAALPTKEIYVMDSGMAAILGASMDPRCEGKERGLLLDIATSHTVGAAMAGEEIAGFFEYHTSDITLERLEALLPALADGDLTHEQILAEGGHGACIRQTIGFDNVEIILATGPRRRLVKNAA